MNLLASYNWIKEYVKTPLDAHGFAKRVSLSGPAVERLYPQAPAFDRMVVGRILEVSQHPNADKLRIVKTDLGDAAHMDIVCGGSNVAEGMLIAVALSGARVRWHGQGDLITLEPTEIRGVKSEAMICGASEIGLGAAFPHAEKEILDLTWTKAKPGTELAHVLHMNDTVMDIEVTTNRPDALSMIGMAREAAAILKTDFTYQEPSEEILKCAHPTLKLSAEITSEKCLRYQAIALTGITVAPSPWWLKQRLIAAGINPINNVVDVTNYVMMEYGQPMHAFDYTMVEGGEIIVREAKEGESIVLLDGKTHELTKGALIIADKKSPLALAGVMGGQASGISDTTTTIILESATFEPVSTRRTARGINQHTDAALRFEKGLPPELTTPALARAAQLLTGHFGATVASKHIDEYPEKPKKVTHKLRTQKVSELIGVDIAKKEVVESLESLGFELEKHTKKGEYTVTVPYWRRRDIEGERDFAEEVARLIGYAQLPSELPAGTIPDAPQDQLIATDERMKSAFKEAGFTELVQYSFISEEMLQKAGFAEDGVVKIANPLTSDFVYMRPSLVPSTLATIAQNQDRFPQAQLFEVAKVYHKVPGNTDIPPQTGVGLAVSYGHDSEQVESVWRDMKGLLENLVGRANIAKCVTARIDDVSMWHPGRTVAYVHNGLLLAVLGEIHPTLTKKFGVTGRVVALEIHRESLANIGTPQLTYKAIPDFPPVLRDIAFVVAENTEFAAIKKAVRAASTFLTEVELFDIFRGKGIEKNQKSLALHLVFSNADATLTTEAVEAEMDRIREALKSSCGATLRS
jgi:phenylalanyl-tRNA synthetase beta chain